MNPLESKDYLCLLAPYQTDGLYEYSLMQTNKLCYNVLKGKLVRKKHKRREWVELPGVPEVYNGCLIKKKADGRLLYKHYYINGLKHGPAFNMHSTLQFYYKHGKLKCEMSRFARDLYHSKAEERPYLIATLLLYLLFFFEGWNCCRRKTPS